MNLILFDIISNIIFIIQWKNFYWPLNIFFWPKFIFVCTKIYFVPNFSMIHLIDFSSKEDKQKSFYWLFTFLNDDNNEETVDVYNYYISNKILYSVKLEENLKK